MDRTSPGVDRHSDRDLQIGGVDQRLVTGAFANDLEQRLVRVMHMNAQRLALALVDALDDATVLNVSLETPVYRSILTIRPFPR